jgi:hypothetical protein
MIAWVLAFLGFPPPTGIPGSLQGLFSLPLQRGSTAPLPARTKTYDKQKAKLSQEKNAGLSLRKTHSSKHANFPNKAGFYFAVNWGCFLGASLRLCGESCGTKVIYPKRLGFLMNADVRKMIEDQFMKRR